MSDTRKLAFEDLEQAFELIAQGIDRAGEARETLFLSKLALALAHRIGDLDTIEAALEEAERDL